LNRALTLLCCFLSRSVAFIRSPPRTDSARNLPLSS